jgi:hypothetical protein
LAGASTCVGAAIVFCFDAATIQQSMTFSLSLAASVMITVSVVSIGPECMEGIVEWAPAHGDDNDTDLIIDGYLLLQRIVSFGVGCTSYWMLSKFLTLVALPDPEHFFTPSSSSAKKKKQPPSRSKNDDDEEESIGLVESSSSTEQRIPNNKDGDPNNYTRNDSNQQQQQQRPRMMMRRTNTTITTTTTILPESASLSSSSSQNSLEEGGQDNSMMLSSEEKQKGKRSWRVASMCRGWPRPSPRVRYRLLDEATSVKMT